MTSIRTQLTIESRFDTSGYAPDRPLPVGRNKKVIGLMKDELGGGIMSEFVTLRPKMYAYKVGDSESKSAKVSRNAWYEKR